MEIFFMRLYSFLPVVLPVWWVRSSVESINSLSHHFAYQMTGSHRFIAFNAERPNDSRHSDGMRQYLQFSTYLFMISMFFRQKKWIFLCVCESSWIFCSLLPEPKTKSSKGNSWFFFSNISIISMMPSNHFSCSSLQKYNSQIIVDIIF